MSTGILKLHHAAYRCRDSEETRQFYQDFLGMPLVLSLVIENTKTGRPTRLLHTFYRMGDGSHIAFFDLPDSPFDFKAQHDFDLHIALEVAPDMLEAMRQKGYASQIETRGIADHGFAHSVYFRDPNGYVVELCAKQPTEGSVNAAACDAREVLNRWTAEKNSEGDGPPT